MKGTVVGLLLLGASLSAQGLLPFSSATYSADEDSQWIMGGASDAAGNAWYIGDPPAEGRDRWLAGLQRYRDAVREHVHEQSETEIAFRGVRAWVRMRNGFAKALDLQPGEPFRIEVEARWVEGNSELVLAFDLLSRESDAWQGWSTVFSTLSLPRDGEWHRLTWEGNLPQFDHTRQWAKLIVGMDATHDATPGCVLLRDFALTIPQRARPTMEALLRDLPQSPALDRSIYDRPDLRWASRAFVCHFTFMYDRSFYDPTAGRFTPERFLAEGDREFGGYDAVVLWHAYPRIGIDERNQFDFYRDMPGGLPGLAHLTERLHVRGVKVFIDYNPWDTGTRREGVPDEQAIARIVAAIGADGVFLDTMSAGGRDLRVAVDAARRGVVFEPEGSPPVEQLEVCSASWAQGLPELAAPGLLRLKWIEPRHMQHQINRWSGSHQRELEAAFFNGSGMLVWENVFGTFNPWNAADRATLRRMAPILRAFAGSFTSDAWDPMVPTLVPGVYANRWPGEGVTLWTILNRTERTVAKPFLRVRVPKRACLFDLWNGKEIALPANGEDVAVATELGPLGCLALVTDTRLIPKARRLVARQAAEAARSLAEPDAHVVAASVVEPKPVQPTPRARADDPPPGMVLVPAGRVTMDLAHQRRECGCYPDPGTPPERWREFLWGAPFNGTLEHHTGPVDLPAFRIDRDEVTNADFARFLQATGYEPKCRTNFLKHWQGAAPPQELVEHPVVYVDLEDARAYARWAGKRLPTEPEWHRAAQGDDGRAWPWGNEFDHGRCNGSSAGTMRVGSYPSGRSPFGCEDMAGNVWEWTESERSDGHTRFCIIRGGSYYRAEGSVWYTPGGAQPNASHTKFILMYPGLDRCSTIGFRCVKDVR
jgi:iron(II)-dependent oxidoreductase